MAKRNYYITEGISRERVLTSAREKANEGDEVVVHKHSHSQPKCESDCKEIKV